MCEFKWRIPTCLRFTLPLLSTRMRFFAPECVFIFAFLRQGENSRIEFFFVAQLSALILSLLELGVFDAKGKHFKDLSRSSAWPLQIRITY
jgi:hypothetical protein